MDPVSVTLSITALLTLTKDVILWTKEAKDAPDERKKFVKEASSLSGLLNTLFEFINDCDPGDPWLQAIPRLAQKDGVLDGLTQSLQLFKDKVNPASMIRKVGHALAWKHVKDDIKDLLSRMERLKTLVGIALELDHIQLSRAMHDQLHDVRSGIEDIALGVSTVRDDASARRKAELLERICGVDYHQQHRDIIGRHQNGTGEWFLDSSTYRDWKNSSHGTLFCPGVPGAGKTMMAVLVVEQLLRETHSAQRPVVFEYYDYKRQDEQTLLHTMQAFLRQVVSILPSLPKSVEDLYRNTPSLEEIKHTLLEVLSHDKKLTIVVDALDECHEQARFDLLNLIEQLQNKIDVNLLATSRDFHAAASSPIFSGQPSLQIKASHEDLGSYVTERAKSLRDSISLDIRKQVVQGVVTVADGMFLLARLLMDSFQDKMTPKSIKDHLQNIPKGIDAYDVAYGNAMERIYGQEKEHREFAKLILSLVFCAARPLSVEELQHALAVQENDVEIDVDNILTIEDICSVCAGLITLDEAFHEIRFVHYTTQEYLDRHQQQWIPQARLEMARRCLWYLSLREFSLGACKTPSSVLDRRKTYPFAVYVAADGMELLNTLFEECNLSLDADFSCRMLNFIKAMPVAHSMQQINRYTFYSAKVRALLTGRRYRKPYLSTTMHWFAFKGWPGLLRLCLEQGSDINQQNNQGLTPLFLAASNEKLKAVEFLLAYERSDASATSIEGDTSSTGADLKSTCLEPVDNRPGKTKMSRNISCLNANIANHEGITPLGVAAANGMPDMVRLLLASDKVDPNVKDRQGRAALSAVIGEQCERRKPLGVLERWAMEPYNKDRHVAIRALCTSPRVDLNTKDDHGHTPLYYAVQRSGDEPRMLEVVDLLLRSDTVDTEPGLVNIEAASEEVREAVEKAHRMRQDRLRKGTGVSTV